MFTKEMDNPMQVGQFDIEGDHTWNGSYGETFGNYGSFSFPQKGIMCVRCGANGANSQVLWWPKWCIILDSTSNRNKLSE